MEVSLENPEQIEHQLTEQDVEHFSTDVNEYAEIERQIQETKEAMEPYQKRLKELKQDKKHLEDEMCNFMNQNNVAECNLPENTGKLKFDKKKTLVRVTDIHIKECILKFFTNEPDRMGQFNTLPGEEKADTLIEYIYKTERKVEDKMSLRKLKPRKTK